MKAHTILIAFFAVLIGSCGVLEPTKRVPQYTENNSLVENAQVRTVSVLVRNDGVTHHIVATDKFGDRDFKYDNYGLVSSNEWNHLWNLMKEHHRVGISGQIEGGHFIQYQLSVDTAREDERVRRVDTLSYPKDTITGARAFLRAINKTIMPDGTELYSASFDDGVEYFGDGDLRNQMPDFEGYLRSEKEADVLLDILKRYQAGVRVWIDHAGYITRMDVYEYKRENDLLYTTIQ